MRLGETLPPADSLQMLHADTRVPGCTSVVHMLASVSAEGTLELSGMADSRLARGLVALLVRGLRGEPRTLRDVSRSQQPSLWAGRDPTERPSRRHAHNIYLYCDGLNAACASGRGE